MNLFKTWISLSSARVTLPYWQLRGAAWHCWGSVAIAASMFVYHVLFTKRCLCGTGVEVEGGRWGGRGVDHKLFPLCVCVHCCVCAQGTECLDVHVHIINDCAYVHDQTLSEDVCVLVRMIINHIRTYTHIFIISASYVRQSCRLA